MNAEKFSFYIKNPAHLYQITYTELKSLVLQYPYCQNLRYLLLKKSVLDKHPELEQNLQLAATYSSDRNFLYQQIKDGESYVSEADSFVLKDEYIELKELGSNPVPSPVQDNSSESVSPDAALSFQDSPEIPKIEEPSEIPAEVLPEEVKSEIIEEENDTLEVKTIEEPEVLLNPELEQEQESLPEPEPPKATTDDNLLEEIEEEEFDDITPDIADLFEDQLADLEIVSLDETAAEDPLFENEEPQQQEEEEENVDDGAISIEDLIRLDSLTPMERLEKSKSKEKAKKEEPKKVSKTKKTDKKELDFEAMDALIEKTKPKKKRKSKKKNTSKAQKEVNQKEKKSKKKESSDSKKDQKAIKAKDVAEKSLKENSEIATETLAFLLVKQEKYKKAIKMYEKLSLIFPEKSSYFAEQIKKTKKLIT